MAPVDPQPLDWPALIQEICATGGPRMVLQPVIDLDVGAIAGYEALARFPVHGPERWFSEARAIGMAAQLEASAIAAGLALRDTLPRPGFLTVNVSPDLLNTPPVRDAFAAAPDLKGVVIELNEQVPIADYDAVLEHLSVLRDRGAEVAVDDAGAGYAGLRHLLALRPRIIKLDRALVADVDRDEAKVALIELMRDFGNRIDAMLIAEGVERIEELDLLISLRVPYAQGFILARPAMPAPELSQIAGARLGHRRKPPLSEAVTLNDLVEVVSTARDGREAVRAFATDPELRVVAIVDDDARPVALVDGDARTESSRMPRVSEGSRMDLHTPVLDATRRAVTRPPKHRFEPILAVDETGRLAGVVWIERLIAAVTGAAEQAERARGAASADELPDV